MKPLTITADDLQASPVPDGLEYLNSVSTPTDDHQDAPEEEPEEEHIEEMTIKPYAAYFGVYAPWYEKGLKPFWEGTQESCRWHVRYTLSYRRAGKG